MHYIFYSERTEEGAVIKNRLTISPGNVELRKTGAGNFNSVLVFDTEHNKNCLYQSPAGPMELVSDTKKIRVLHGDAHFKLQLKYSLIMNGMLVSDYDLTVLAKFMEDVYKRQVMEGICYEMYDIIRAEEDSGIKIDKIRLAGGAAKSPLWCQMMADIFKHPIQILERCV